MSNLSERATGTDVAQRGGTDMNAKIRQMERQFQLAMPQGAEAAQLVRDAMTCMSNNPKLMECDPKSVLGSLMTCAQLGLRPGVPGLGHAWLIPMWDRGTNKAQLIIGYLGMVDLAQRSGRIASISARTVHEQDEFFLEYGTDEKLIHRPLIRGARGEVIGYYSVVKVEGGGIYQEFMSVEDAKVHRDKFAMAKKRDGSVVGPWKDHFDAMALKTVVKKALKLAPKNTDLRQAIQADETIRMNVEPSAEIAEVSVTSVSDIPATNDTVDSGVPVDDRPVEFDPTLSESWGVQ